MAKDNKLFRSQARSKAKFGSALEKVDMPDQAFCEVPILWIEKSQVISLLAFLKDEPDFEYCFLADMTATDEMPRQPRFDVIYNLFSHKSLARIRVKTRVSETESLPTAISVWEGANWAEREIWDMFGIRFSGHPNLKRVLMDNRWDGHPLRKDYPLRRYQIFSMPQEIDLQELESRGGLDQGGGNHAKRDS